MATTCRFQTRSALVPNSVRKSRGTDHGIAVSDHVLELLDEPVVDCELRLEVVELGHRESSSLPNVGVLVLEALLQRVGEVVDDLLGPKAAHGSDGESSHEGIWVGGVLGAETRGHVSAIEVRGR